MQAMEQITKLLLKHRRYLYLAGGIIVAAALFFAAFSGKDRPLPADFLQEDSAGDVAGYMRDCVDGVLKGGAIPESCHNAEGVHQVYGIDIWFLLRAERARAIDTAQRIVSGQILKEKDYRACVKKGDCSDLPLPRSGKNAEQQEAILRFLQSLADGREIDPQVCAFLDICRALVKVGLYDMGPQKEE